MVVKEPGSLPLRKVLVQLIAEDQKHGGNYTADTDSDGHFRIEKIEPGRYRFLLEKTGFHTINLRGRRTEGAILSVRAGQEISDLFFQMLPAAVITGLVSEALKYVYLLALPRLNFQEVYGPFAISVSLMFWAFLVGLLLLLGAHLSAEAHARGK